MTPAEALRQALPDAVEEAVEEGTHPFVRVKAERIVDAARVHAIAARRAGASWREIHKVVELAALTGGFTALTIGDGIIARLRAADEQTG